MQIAGFAGMRTIIRKWWWQKSIACDVESMRVIHDLQKNIVKMKKSELLGLK